MCASIRPLSTTSAKQVAFDRRRTSSKALPVIMLAVFVVAYGCLAWTFLATSLHHRGDDNADGHRGGARQDELRLPIPLSTVRNIEAVSRQLLYNHRRQRMGGVKVNMPEKENHSRLSPEAVDRGGGGDPTPSVWSWPMIHIVSTRFMQGQGTLVNLAKSRLKLLEVITLPSLMGQTVLDPIVLSEVYEGTKWEGALDGGQHHGRNVIDVSDPVFIWIIKVDPNLDVGILNELRAMLKPVERFTLVIGSNTNYGIGIKPGGWRGGEASMDVLNAYDDGRVYFPIDDDDGDRSHRMIRRAHEARDDRVVLETRLDADDAVNVDYFVTLQRRALRTLVDRSISNYYDDRVNDYDDYDENDRGSDEYERSQTARWLYWCPKTHVQWNPSSSDGASDSPGMLQVLQIPYTCITPGLTLGFAVGTREKDVPRYPHDKLFWELTVNHNITGTRNKASAGEVVDGNDVHDCGLYPSSRCAVYVQHPRVSAFRSRSLTSAGMNNIETRGKPSLATDDAYDAFASRLWEHTIKDHFGIETERAMEAANFLHANYLGTIRDNLRGQCNHGHSCKISSIEKLQCTIDVLEEESGGVQVRPRGR
ncbi:hypothetical protein ACHAXA_004286 [Cyclostephanos tholiformis]|uniref:Hexosyltransferase n=1 Tax=Cyclostephanos tholiformis TaxID=382380 RepID=A0ABD3SG44_9STRA